MIAILSSLLEWSKPDHHLTIVFGTDGDISLSQACQVCFTEAHHLLCDIHTQDNVKRKLLALNICGQPSNTIMNDIFGILKGSVKDPGLVDCLSENEF